MARPTVTIAKYGGDDSLSWAVFVKGNPRPVLTGLGRREAQYHRDIVKQQLNREETAR